MRQFAWILKSYFLEKNWEVFQNVVRWNFYPDCYVLIFRLIMWSSHMMISTLNVLITIAADDILIFFFPFREESHEMPSLIFYNLA